MVARAAGPPKPGQRECAVAARSPRPRRCGGDVQSTSPTQGGCRGTSSQRLAVDGGLIAWLGRAATAPATITLGAVVCAFILGRIIVGIARPLLARLAGRTANEWDDRLVS